VNFEENLTGVIPGQREALNYGAQARTWESHATTSRFRVRCFASPRN